VLAVPNVLERQALEPALGDTHRRKEVARIPELAVLLLLIPPELLRHDVDDSRESLEGSLRVEEGETGTASDDVDGGSGVLAADTPGDFGVDVGVDGVETGAVDGETKTGSGSKSGDAPSAVTVGLAEMLSDVEL
jgi:hypothetical protein